VLLVLVQNRSLIALDALDIPGSYYRLYCIYIQWNQLVSFFCGCDVMNAVENSESLGGYILECVIELVWFPIILGEQKSGRGARQKIDASIIYLCTQMSTSEI
jgi:hypothetical protein